MMEAVAQRPIRVLGLDVASPRRKLRLAARVGFVASVAAWALVLRPQVLGGPASYLIVSGHSMDPTLHTGDLVIALKQSVYRRGDVIAYHIPNNQAGAGAVVIHRIVGGSAQDGYVTRGDNRTYRDPWRPKQDDVAGRMRLHVPRLGLLPVLAHTVPGMALIGALAAFAVLRGGTHRRPEKHHVSGAADAWDDPEGVHEVELAPEPGVAELAGQNPRAEPGADDAVAEPIAEGSVPEVEPSSAGTVPRSDNAAVALTRAAEDDGLLPELDSTADPEPAGHMLFIWAPTGYELLERDGEPPAGGTVVAHGERLYRVSKLARSPLPADDRLCAYLDLA
jgi:signal peptidase